MRKRIALLLALLLLAGLFPAAYADDAHSVEKREFTVYVGNIDETLTEPFPLYFLDGVDDLPYLEIDDLGELIFFVNTTINEDPNYGLSSHYDGDIVSFERENGYTVEFDFAQDLIRFTDYNAFLHNSYDTTLIDVLTEPGVDEYGRAQLFQRDKKMSFDRYGDVKIFDLAAYDIDLVRVEDSYFVPLQTANDIFFHPTAQLGFLFNGEAIFYASEKTFYVNGEYTEYADLYYKAPTGQRSDALADFGYHELCMMLDNFYGLKDSHDIRSFAQTFWEIGFDEALRGNDPVDADEALKQFVEYYLDDLHSGFHEFSYLSGRRAFDANNAMANRKITENVEIYSKAREAFYPDGCPNYEEVGNTAYITFDSFDSDYYGQAFYAGLEDGTIPDDTIGLIIYAHQQITRPDSPVENVVLDLSNNTGGAVDAAIFVVGWILGEAPFSIKDTCTGAMSTSIYRSDVTLDREFDERDTVADKKLYCLISPVSFSCGNLVPAALKSSQKVTLLGRTSGGGSCVVRPASAAWGAMFQISGAQRMSFLKNGSFYDIDQGVDPDYYIDNISNFYNRQALTDYINNLF